MDNTKFEKVCNIIDNLAIEKNGAKVILDLGSFLEQIRDLFKDNNQEYMRVIYLTYGYHCNKNINGIDNLESLKERLK